MTLGLVDEDEDEHETTDRAYWIKRGSQKTVGMCDELPEIVKKLDPELELKYNKFYIGLAKNGQPDNFVVFMPKKSVLRMDPSLSMSDETKETLDAAGLDVASYDANWGRYRIRLTPGDVETKFDVITQILTQAFEEWNS